MRAKAPRSVRNRTLERTPGGRPAGYPHALSRKGLATWMRCRRASMPEICRFEGIVIGMFYRDHNPPHFHARYGAFEAAISIGDGRLLWGTLPRRIVNRIEAWRTRHRGELEVDWQRAQNRQPLQPIEPLP